MLASNLLLLWVGFSRNTCGNTWGNRCSPTFSLGLLPQILHKWEDMLVSKIYYTIGDCSKEEGTGTQSGTYCTIYKHSLALSGGSKGNKGKDGKHLLPISVSYDKLLIKQFVMALNNMEVHW